MARLTECKGGCGRRVRQSSTTAKDGPVCRECRSLLPDRVCIVCGDCFRDPRHPQTFCCSRLCGAIYRHRFAASTEVTTP